MAQQSDIPGGITLDPNFLKNFNPWDPSQTVIENVFGDTRTYDPNTNTWNMSQDQASKDAYDRFTSLNPPATLPKLPSLDGLKNGFFGTLLVLFLGLVVVLKIIK
jgi:hypothetical protein